MTTEQAALRLNVSAERVRQLIRDKRLPATKEPGSREYRVKAKDLLLVKDRPITGRPKRNGGGK